MESLKKRLILSIILLVIVIFGCLILLFGSGRFQFDSSAEDGNLSGMSQQEIEELMQNKVDKSMLAISINSTPEFADGKSKGSLRIENSASNLYNMKVRIVVNETNQVIYESGGIKPGQMIKDDELDVELAQGTYPCTATFIAYDVESNKQAGEAAAKLNIQILK